MLTADGKVQKIIHNPKKVIHNPTYPEKTSQHLVNFPLVLLHSYLLIIFKILGVFCHPHNT